MKLLNILNGWSNLIQSKTIGISSYIEEQTKLRLEICNSCEMNVRNVCDKQKVTSHVITNEEVYGCGCPLSAKTMAQDDYCPAGKWMEMLNAEEWMHAIDISKYDKLSVIVDNNIIMFFNNKKDGIFVSIDGNIGYSYKHMAKLMLKRKLITVAMLDASRLLTVNETTNSFKYGDDLINYVKTLNHQDIVFWMPKNMMPDISVGAFVQKCELFTATVSSFANKNIKYICGITNDIKVIKDFFEHRGVYKEGSTISESLKDKI
jgi:hypothetical protein